MLVIFEIRRELRIYQVNHYLAAFHKLDAMKTPKKLLFLSDLHNQVYGSNNDGLLENIRQEQPDIILIGGDMLVGKKGYAFDTALSFVRRLPAIAPTYYANGNHEQRIKENPEKYQIDYETYKMALIKSGVHFLENETTTFLWDSIPVSITGIELPLKKYKHFSSPRLSYQEVSTRIGVDAGEGFNILLAHNPAYMEEYKRWGADLVLSGHFHGGLIRIPGIRGIIIPGIGKYKKYSGGIYLEDEKRIVVSKGLGNHTVRLRLFNKAEVICLHVQGKNQPAKKK